MVDENYSLPDEPFTKARQSQMKNENTIKNQGMPMIREAETNRRTIIALICLMMVPSGYLVIKHFINNKKNVPDMTVAEETYSVPQDETINATRTSSQPFAQQVVAAKPTEIEQQQRLAFIQAKQKELQQRLAAPMLVVKSNTDAVNAASSAVKPALSDNANTNFMNQVSAQIPDTVQAMSLTHLNYLITQGHLIHAVLESAINSDLPGYIRAEIREPVYAEDGSQVLIPPGSRLIGQYRSGMTQGQSRIFVVWNRVITPAGVSVNLGSPGVDNLGVVGFGADRIDRHFWAQFGSAILLSIISAGASNIDVGANDQYNAAQAYRVAMANSFSDTANQSLKKTAAIPPTLYINQGRPIMVFVAHDLDFRSTIQQTQPQRNVF